MKKSKFDGAVVRGTVVAFDRQWCTGTAIYDLTPVCFHSTSYQGINNSWPRAGARVEIVFNSKGELVSLHEIKS